MELYAELDLHSRNTYIGIMDKAFKPTNLFVEGSVLTACCLWKGGVGI